MIWSVHLNSFRCEEVDWKCRKPPKCVCVCLGTLQPVSPWRWLLSILIPLVLTIRAVKRRSLDYTGALGGEWWSRWSRSDVNELRSHHFTLQLRLRSLKTSLFSLQKSHRFHCKSENWKCPERRSVPNVQSGLQDFKKNFNIMKPKKTITLHFSQASWFVVLKPEISVHHKKMKDI